MRRLTCLLLIAVACSGCGAFRKVLKLKESHSVEVTQERKTDSVGIRLDRSITTINETVDTSITTPARTVIQDTPFNMDSLVNGMTAIKNDLIDVRLHLNPITGVISTIATLKPQKLPVKMNRVTTKQSDITEQSHKQEAVLSQTKTEDRSRRVDKEPIKFPNWLITFAIILVAGAAFLFWWRRSR
jgi:hypothetical protein